MTYPVRLSSAARNALLAELPAPLAGACLAFLSGAVSENPLVVGTALQGPLAGLRCARRGRFRVLYAVAHDGVLVLSVQGH